MTGVIILLHEIINGVNLVAYRMV